MSPSSPYVAFFAQGTSALVLCTRLVAHLMHISFCLMQENVHCHKCGKDTHQHSYVQYFYNVMSTSISVQGVFKAGQPLGKALKDIEGQSQKSCDTDKGTIAPPVAVS